MFISFLAGISLALVVGFLFAATIGIVRDLAVAVAWLGHEITFKRIESDVRTQTLLLPYVSWSDTVSHVVSHGEES